MKALGWTCIATLLLLIAAVLHSEYQARQHRNLVQAEIHSLTVSVERLATGLERMLRAQGDLLVDPIIIVSGDPSIGEPIVTEWKSGNNTIIVKVYKETEDETGAIQLRRAVAAQLAAAETYPPN